MGTGRKEMTKQGPVSFKSGPVSCTCRGPAEPDFTQQINVVWMKRVFQMLAALRFPAADKHWVRHRDRDRQKAGRQTQAVTHRAERQTERQTHRE